MNPYDIGVKVSHRFLWGFNHHSHMASFFDLLKMPITSDNQRKNAIEDAKKRQKMDEYITHTYNKIPVYTATSVHAIAEEIRNATYEIVKANKPEWIKKGIEALARYEKETIGLLETWSKEAKEAGDSKLEHYLKKFCEDAKEELQVIEHFYSELQKHNFDYEKFKKEKGDLEMPRRYYSDDRYDDEYEDRRRRRMEMDDYFLPLWMDDERYEPMGFADRHYREDREYPYEIEDARRRRYRRRYR